MLTTATTASVEQGRRQHTGPAVLGGRSPFPCQQQQTTRSRSKAILQKTPTQRWQLCGTQEKQGRQVTSPTSILKVLTDCAVHLLLSRSNGDFLHRKEVFCILSYQNKIKTLLKLNKQKTSTTKQFRGTAFNAYMSFILPKQVTEVSDFPISLLHLAEGGLPDFHGNIHLRRGRLCAIPKPKRHWWRTRQKSGHIHTLGASPFPASKFKHL